MPELSRNILMCFLTSHHHLGDNITKIGLKHNSDTRFGDENPIHLISNSTVMATIRATHVAEAVIDEEKYFSQNHHSYYRLSRAL